MKEIEKYKKYIGKYIRNKYGIAKIVNVLENEGKVALKLDNKIVFRVNKETGEINDKNLYDIYHINKNKTLENRIKDLIDLIEAGDVLELRDYIDNFKQSEKIGVSDTLMLMDIKEGIYEHKVKLLSILTHEQYEQNCHRVEE